MTSTAIIEIDTAGMSSAFADHLLRHSFPSLMQIWLTAFGIACMHTVLKVLSAVEHRLKVVGT